MSDYTQITDFSAKDALPSGNAAKIIKGSDFDAEFAAIAAAITSKADNADLSVLPLVTGYSAVTAPGSLVTVSPSTTVTLDSGHAAGTRFWIQNTGSGLVHLVPGSGVTLRLVGGNDYIPSYGRVEFMALSTTVYAISGDLTSGG